MNCSISVNQISISFCHVHLFDGLLNSALCVLNFHLNLFPASLFCFIQEKTEIVLCLDERSEGKDKHLYLGSAKSKL
jgi:hypothetical protein